MIRNRVATSIGIAWHFPSESGGEISGIGSHGGAARFLCGYKNYTYNIFSKKIFVSICPIECDVTSNNPKDLLKMGDVARLEYFCFAQYAKRFKKLPKFNDKKESPKHK